MGKTRNIKKTPEGKKQVEDLSTDGRITLKSIAIDWFHGRGLGTCS